MVLTREEVADRNDGNRFFAAVAEELMLDFNQEGQYFYGQGVEAKWDVLWDSFFGVEEIVLNVKGANPTVYDGGVSLIPCRKGKEGAFGVTILVLNGGGSFSVNLYKDDVSEFDALAVCRLVCVARFGVAPMRSY